MSESATIGIATTNEVDAFLKSQLEDLQGTPSVKQFKGGASNLTYLLRYENRDLILRCAPPGRKAAGSHNMVREAGILQALKPSYGLVPEVYLLVEGDDNPLKTPFYVMENLTGLILRSDLPEGR